MQRKEVHKLILSSHHCQALYVTPRYNLMSMGQANLELTHCHHLLLRVTVVLEISEGEREIGDREVISCVKSAA